MGRLHGYMGLLSYFLSDFPWDIYLPSFVA
jgi:hypothetical protein